MTKMLERQAPLVQYMQMAETEKVELSAKNNWTHTFLIYL